MDYHSFLFTGNLHREMQKYQLGQVLRKQNKEVAKSSAWKFAICMTDLAPRPTNYSENSVFLESSVTIIHFPKSVSP